MSSPSKKRKYVINKPKNFFKRAYLEVGQRGFLATCNFREKDCIRESLNILNQYADELYGPHEPSGLPGKKDDEEAGGTTKDTGDITDELQKEIDATKQQNKGKDATKQRFQVVDTGTPNFIFIRTALPDPVELGTRIVTDIASTREQKSRFLLRLIPIDVVCRANRTDITTAGGLLFDKYFLKESSTFSIVFNKRYNNSLQRDDVIADLAELVKSKNIANRVDLKHAAKTVVVEVIKGLCCLSVVDKYLQYRKYNLVELANVKDEKSKDQCSAEKEKSKKVDNENEAEETKEESNGKGETLHDNDEHCQEESLPVPMNDV